MGSIIKISPFTPDLDRMRELAIKEGVCEAVMKKYI
jgi:hypothetical protein